MSSGAQRFFSATAQDFDILEMLINDGKARNA
jgi:hypothetical protein